MTVEIQLTKGYTATIDDEDTWVAKFRWYVLIANNGKVYAYRRQLKHEPCPGKTILMHRALMSIFTGKELRRNDWVDHIDSNGLNNTRENLRLATPSQNLFNQGKMITNKSGFKGVSRHPSSTRNPWKAIITANGFSYYLGCFPTPEEAYAAYCEAALRLHKEFANFGDGVAPATVQLALPFPQGTRANKPIKKAYPRKKAS